ncbi:DUF6274 family protein [Streptomyces sp. NPDC002896]|uniref:DUF6274 family protein n=1 Tax=Streptomyces sp. NPDC002896 TaxID=3154438 RepID=UPI0033298570
MPVSARHETRALLRAHLSAASGYRHLTRHCPICHQLLRLAMEPTARPSDDGRGSDSSTVDETGGESAREAGEDQSLPRT